MSAPDTLEARKAILKEIYGPRYEATGTYAQVCAAVALRRKRRYCGALDEGYRRAAEKLGAKVRISDPIHDAFYRDAPMFAMLRPGWRPPPPPPIDEGDVHRTQRGRHGQ